MQEQVLSFLIIHRGRIFTHLTSWSREFDCATCNKLVTIFDWVVYIYNNACTLAMLGLPLRNCIGSLNSIPGKRMCLPCFRKLVEDWPTPLIDEDGSRIQLTTFHANEESAIEIAEQIENNDNYEFIDDARPIDSDYVNNVDLDNVIEDFKELNLPNLLDDAIDKKDTAIAIWMSCVNSIAPEMVIPICCKPLVTFTKSANKIH